MKTIICFIAVLVLTSDVLIAQQKSDYATVQRFKSITRSISEGIDQARSVQECAEENASIDAMVKEFTNEKALLDKAIYPDGFDQTVRQLRSKLLVRQKDLGFIESQVVRITELETKVRELSDQVMRLNSQNEKLLSDIQMLSQNVKKLTGDLFTATTPLDSLRNMIVKLRQGLQERDALIFALTDSLFLQYDKNVGDMKDVEKQGLMGKIEQHSIIGNIKRSIMDNVTFLEATQLKGSDLVTLVRQQKRFQSQWTGLAPRLAALYLSGKTKKNEVMMIDSMLAVWGDKVDDAMWRSLGTLFREKGFFVKEFKNGEEFGVNFVAFLDEQILNPNNETNDTRFKLYANFNENLWHSDLFATWLPALTELNKISETQKKDIEEKVDKWHSTVSPGASWLIYVLVLLGVILIPVLAIRFFPKAPQATPQG